jgi:hypothetical protein
MAQRRLGEWLRWAALPPPNLLCYGDNLDVLRLRVRDESVDLVYLDPPFKWNQDYNVPFAEHGTRSAAQIKAFENAWRWDQAASDFNSTRTRRPAAGQTGRTALIAAAARSDRKSSMQPRDARKRPSTRKTTGGGFRWSSGPQVHRASGS